MCLSNVMSQLVSHCVDVLVTAFKDTIITECPLMIKNNETESESLILINNSCHHISHNYILAF